MRAVMLITLALLLSTPWAAAQDMSAPADTLETHAKARHEFRPTSLIMPAGILAIGAVGLIDNSPVQKLSDKIHGHFKDGRVKHVSIDDYLRFTPLAMNIGLSLCGVKSKHNFRDRFFATGSAYVCTIALTNGLKYTVRERRPDGSDRHSFPSGHAAFVFTGAELVRTEFGPWCGLAAYSFATCVGILRMTNDRHWCHDVIAGAGIGILSARLGYWMVPVWNRVFRFMDKNKGISCMPSFDPYSNTVSLSCNMLL